MKKLIMLCVGSCSLMACATFQQEKNWAGQNFDNFIIRYGVPTSQHTLQNGNIAYSFVKQCPYVQTQEEVVVVVNQNNIIDGVSRVGSCPSAYDTKKYNEYVDPQVNYLREQEMKKDREQRERIQNQIYKVKNELFELEHSHEYYSVSQTIEQRVKYYEDFYKEYPNTLELDKLLGNETDVYKKAKEAFEKDQPKRKELESRRQQLRNQLEQLQSQLPPEEVDPMEKLLDKWF